MLKPLPENRFKYTEDNWQAPPSSMLVDYMRKNNLSGKMSIEDAQIWFYGLRDSLKKKDRRNVKE